MSYDDPKQMTIEGLVVPSDWDFNGNAISISISTFNEDEYIVDKDSVSKKLMSYIRESVEVKGFVREENKVKRIKIRRFRRKNMPFIP